MKIFILEDSEQRINFFKEVLDKHDLFITDNITSAINYIDDNYTDIDLYFLDHDLGEHVEENGVVLAKYMKDKEINGRIIIHSMNYFGAQEMMFYLPQAEYIPMSLIIKKLL